jgi:hypothetical protein
VRQYFFLIVGLAACRSRPAAGARCRVLDQLVCEAPGKALVCEPALVGPADAGGTADLAWSSVPCKGARGCVGAPGAASAECDDTVGGEGDPCPRSPPLDYACSADRTRALVCQAGRFALWRACRGPDGCQVEGGRNVRCDTTLGLPGDPCAQSGTYSCAVDQQSMLMCDGGALSAASSCRGPAGCRIRKDERKVDCDDAIAVEGDPCDQDGRISCAADGKAELVCTDRQYRKKRDCRRSDCRLDGNELFCD